MSDDIFAGTAKYYRLYRPQPPKEIVQLIRHNFILNHKDRCLDIGTGTGQIPILFASNFKEVVAIDSSFEMLREARDEIQKRKLENIRFLHMAAEDLDEKIGKFKLVVFSSSFHWMEKAKVLSKCSQLIQVGGGGIILAGRSIWNQQGEWQLETLSLIQKYIGKDRRAGSQNYKLDSKPFIAYLEEAGFEVMEYGVLEQDRVYTPKLLLGMLYSTSFAKKDFFGKSLKQFELELTQKLYKLFPKKTFQVTELFDYIIFKKG